MISFDKFWAPMMRVPEGANVQVARRHLRRIDHGTQRRQVRANGLSAKALVRIAPPEGGAYSVTSERVTGRLAVRLALQAFENRVHLAEPVLRVSVSLYTNPPSAGPEAVRWGRDHSNV